MESMEPLYIASFLISLAVIAYGWWDKKQSDKDFESFFEDDHPISH